MIVCVDTVDVHSLDLRIVLKFLARDFLVLLGRDDLRTVRAQFLFVRGPLFLGLLQAVLRF